jgi:hypothetical protein
MPILLSTIAAVAMGLTAAHAMPVAPLDPAETSLITSVAQGCGVFSHRGPAGHCRPLYNCPPGFHTGPFGRHCYRNH